VHQAVKALVCFSGRGAVVALPLSPATATTALVDVGGNYKHLGLMFTIGNLIKKEGMFSGDEYIKQRNVSFTFEDMTQGAAYWYVVLHFLIWGVERGLFSIPGLETTEDEDGASNLRRAEAQAIEMLRKCEADLPEERLPSNHFYGPVDAVDEETPSTPANVGPRPAIV